LPSRSSHIFSFPAPSPARTSTLSLHDALPISSDREFDGNKVHLSLTANPSHLEIVNPVVLGKVRAKQDQNGATPDDRTMVLPLLDRKSTRLNSSHVAISYAVFCLKKKRDK